MPCSCDAFLSGTKHAKFKIALFIALFLSLGMFSIEILGSIYANSSSLLADASDFMGDSLNYIISLSVLNVGLYYRSWASLFKGVTMTLFGLMVLIKTSLMVWTGQIPEPLTIGLIGFLALIANSITMIILYKFHDGDSNMQSIWLCTRNDMVGNCAILLASLGILETHTFLPDLFVALTMTSLGIIGGIKIIKLALQEQKKVKTGHPCSCCH